MSFVFAYAMLACIVLPLAAQRYLDAIFLVVSGALMLLGVLVSTRRRDGYNGSASAANVRAPGVLHFLITGLVVLSVTTSDYPWVYTLTTYAFLLAATFNFDRADSIDSSWSRRPLPRVASCVASLVIAWQVVAAFITGEPLVLWGSWDGNFSGMVALLHLMWCLKNRFHVGSLVALSTILVTESRLFLGLVILLYLLRVGKRILPVEWRAKRGTVAVVFAIMAVITVPISAYWIDVVSANGVDSYRASLNDTSNRMRFSANLKAVEQMQSDPSLMLFGYDNDVKKVLGVVDVDEGRASQLRGERAIVPHNGFFNLALRAGVVFAVVYFLIVGRIVDRFFTRHNFEFVVTYIVGSLIMHSLLIGPMLILWLLVLAVPLTQKIDSGRSVSRPETQVGRDQSYGIRSVDFLHRLDSGELLK